MVPCWGGGEAARAEEGLRSRPTCPNLTRLAPGKPGGTCSLQGPAHTHAKRGELQQDHSPVRLWNVLPVVGEGDSPCGPSAADCDPATVRRPPGAVVSWSVKLAAKGAAAGLLP